MFERRHYKVIANVLRNSVEDSEEGHTVVGEFIDFFTATEINFNEEKFLMAVWD